MGKSEMLQELAVISERYDDMEAKLKSIKSDIASLERS